MEGIAKILESQRENFPDQAQKVITRDMTKLTGKRILEDLPAIPEAQCADLIKQTRKLIESGPASRAVSRVFEGLNLFPTDQHIYHGTASDVYTK